MITFFLTWFLVSLVLGVLAGHCIHAMGEEKESDRARPRAATGQPSCIPEVANPNCN